jgi:hypothetical protein
MVNQTHFLNRCELIDTQFQTDHQQLNIYIPQ